MIPGPTIAYRVYKDGKTFVGTSTVELPKLGFMSETISGSGIVGEIEMPAIGMVSSMSTTLNWINQCAGFYDVLDDGESNNLELRASIQHVDETTGLRTSKASRISMLTMPKNVEFGSAETGKQQGGSTEFELSRLKVEFDGDEKLLIDKMAFIFRVNGKDRLAKVRADLGMES